LREFGPDRTAHEITKAAYADPPVTITFPPDHAEVELQTDTEGAARPVVLRAEGGELPLTWMIDGVPIASEPFARDASFVPSSQGFSKVSVVDAAGRVDRVSVEWR
jgi:penicillin-binding protein 1C